LRVFYVDAGRFPYVLFFSFVLHTVRNDNEDNAVAALKALCDCARMLKTVPESSLDELSPLFSEVCRNLIQSVPELFAAGRPPSDPQVLHPAVRSSRVVTEIMNMILSYLQAHRQLPTKNLMGALTVNFQLLSVEIPVQKQTRENHEAMGGIWAGMSPDITNTKEYEDMTLCLIRVRNMPLLALGRS
jgi:transformation/transcription domain-associated protein